MTQTLQSIGSEQTERFATDIARLRMQLEHAQNEIVELQRHTFSTLHAMMSFRAADKAAHDAWVGLWSERMAEVMGMPPDFCRHLHQAALVHDIGLVGLPDSILNKQSPLTEEELELVRLHPMLGALMIGPQRGDELMKLTREVVLHHHERYDGSGYPSRLAGDNIPLEARIVAVMDVFESLQQPRPHRAPFTKDAALQFVADGRGSFFDPWIVGLFVENAGYILSPALET